MEQLFEIKKRMKSVNDIGQMTKAMQLVSSAKMRKSRALLEQVLPFFSICAESMVELRKHNHEINNPYFQFRKKKKGEPWKIGYFILTGDQGLAGAYNQNVIRLAEDHIKMKKEENEKQGYNAEITLYVFGSVGKEKLVRDGYPIDTDFSFPISNPNYYQARNVADIIRDKYMTEELDSVYLIFTKLETAVKIKPIVTRIVPVNESALHELFTKTHIEDAGMATSGGELSYHPNAVSVFSFLIDTYLNAMMYGAMVEAHACEQTARMTAMDNATQNASEMLEKLTLKSNQARQTRITNELIEIVNGAEQVQNE